MTYFLDSSALVKRYRLEPGSDRVRALFRRNRDVAVVRITSAEVAAAIARQCREGLISESNRDAIFIRMDGDFSGMKVVEVRAPVLALIPSLVVRWPLRGYDAVQLAAALRVNAAGIAVDFWCGDARLLAAAHGEGLRATAV